MYPLDEAHQFFAMSVSQSIPTQSWEHKTPTPVSQSGVTENSALCSLTTEHQESQSANANQGQRSWFGDFGNNNLAIV